MWGATKGGGEGKIEYLAGVEDGGDMDPVAGGNRKEEHGQEVDTELDPARVGAFDVKEEAVLFRLGPEGTRALESEEVRRPAIVGIAPEEDLLEQCPGLPRASGKSLVLT